MSILQNNPRFSLESMIEDCSTVAEKNFAKWGEVKTHWVALTRDDRIRLIPRPPGVRDKSVMAALIRAVLAEIDAVRVVFIDEAWQVRCETQAETDDISAWYDTHNGLEDYPGRLEIVVFEGEDEDGSLLSGSRKIIRTGDKPVLEPLETHVPKSSGGRLTGWLPGRGLKQ